MIASLILDADFSAAFMKTLAGGGGSQSGDVDICEADDRDATPFQALRPVASGI